MNLIHITLLVGVLATAAIGEPKAHGPLVHVLAKALSSLNKPAAVPVYVVPSYSVVATPVHYPVPAPYPVPVPVPAPLPVPVPAPVPAPLPEPLPVPLPEPVPVLPAPEPVPVPAPEVVVPVPGPVPVFVRDVPFDHVVESVVHVPVKVVHHVPTLETEVTHRLVRSAGSARSKGYKEGHYPPAAPVTTPDVPVTPAPALPVEPVVPVLPVEPVAPVAPVVPALPVDPVVPVLPVDPVVPVLPGNPVAPVVDVVVNGVVHVPALSAPTFVRHGPFSTAHVLKKRSVKHSVKHLLRRLARSHHHHDNDHDEGKGGLRLKHGGKGLLKKALLVKGVVVGGAVVGGLVLKKVAVKGAVAVKKALHHHGRDSHGGHSGHW